MDRSEALRLLALDRRSVPEGQEYTAAYFEPADGPGVARLFYAVYGDGYPIDTYYIPERLAEENRRGAIRSVVARTSGGDVISHVAFYRSSPPNPNLYEYGVGLTLPSYRSTMAFYRVTQLLMKLLGQDGIDGFYGEAVCNHIITQKLSKQARALETAVEPALMPARAYETEQSAAGRVGCMVYFRVARDCRRKLYAPVLYRNELPILMDGLNLDRELVVSDAAIPPGDGEIEVKRFDFAGLARCTVTTPGARLAGRLAGLEEELRRDDYALIQFFVDLGKPWSGGVVEQLGKAGYSLGGLLPTWFGDDGLLMQKHFVDPDFAGMKIFSERGRGIVEMVRKDWDKTKVEL
ncbi:MAG TPA: hypothetical protein VMJ66_14380 [Geobacteraceae bacterium]|nr:hypothetical protein [Geobacteraceae bacterium]